MSPEKRQLLTALHRIRGAAYAPGDIQDASDDGSTASLVRVANLDQLEGDGPHALSANGFDVVVVRTPAGGGLPNCDYTASFASNVLRPDRLFRGSGDSRQHRNSHSGLSGRR